MTEFLACSRVLQDSSCIFIVLQLWYGMPRPSKEKTNVATLRILLGEKQDGFAKLIGCSIHTLQSVETGRMKLGKSLAARISLITGVHIEWLLKNLKCKPFAAVPNRYI